MRKKQYIIKDKTVSSRSTVLFLIFTMIFLVIIIKLIYLQLFSNKYSIEEHKDSIFYTKLDAKRGDIYDRNKNVLAKSVMVYNGYFSTKDYNLYKKLNEKLKKKEDEKLDKIFELLKLNKEEILKKASTYDNLLIKDNLTKEQKLKIQSKDISLLNVKDNKLYFSVIEYDKFKLFSKKNKQKQEEKLDDIFTTLDIDKKKVFDRAERGTSFKIKKSVDPEIAKEIISLNSSVISMEIEESRNYVDGKFAPYVVGHSNENGGQTGIENYFNDTLSGTQGAKKIIRENLNKSIQDIVNPVDGKDVYLTLDSTIEQMISKYGKEYFEKENPIKLNIIVSDVTNGDILAMDSFPKYDLNNPTKPRTEEEKKEFDEIDEKEKMEKIFSMWRNTAISDAYEPGSVFKLISGSSALEEGTDTLDSIFYCNGIVNDIPNVVLKCFNWRHPHGREDFTKAMDNSCNPAFIQIARNLGRDKMFKYIKGFGFGRKTEIELPGEFEGQIPQKVEDIGITELSTMGYGHGISATPIQVITAANAVVNGGYVLKPQITLKNVENDNGNIKIKENTPIIKNQVISKETSDKMRNVMEHGVKEGIVRRLASDKVRIGAKSGTTLKVINNKYDDYKTVASIYAAFPIENPKYSVLIVFDEPKSDTTGTLAASPLAKKIIEDIVTYKQIASDQDDNVVVKTTSVPDVRGLTLEYACDVLESKFLKYSVSNSESSPKSIVKEQNEFVGKNVTEGTTVELTLSEDKDEKLIVIDFSKMSYEKAMEAVEKMGYNCKTSGGKGKFLSCNKQVGSYTSKDEQIVLTFDK